MNRQVRGGENHARKPVEDLKLQGDMAALKTKYLEAVTEKTENASHFAREKVLPFLEHARVDEKTNEGFKVVLYTQARLNMYTSDMIELNQAGKDLEENTGEKISYTIKGGKPPEDTPQTLKDKIELVKAVK